jgi:hypothetical protein
MSIRIENDEPRKHTIQGQKLKKVCLPRFPRGVNSNERVRHLNEDYPSMDDKLKCITIFGNLIPANLRRTRYIQYSGIKRPKTEETESLLFK